MGKGQAVLVWCPFPDRGSARTVADALLDERLIACANLLGPVESIFRWDGERGSASEIGVLFKTNAVTAEQMISRLGELHPYDTPAITGWSCDKTHPSTAAWLTQECRSD